MEKKFRILFCWMLLMVLLAGCASAINGGSLIVSQGLAQTQVPEDVQIDNGVGDPGSNSKEASPATSMPKITATSLIPKITRTPAPILPPDA